LEQQQDLSKFILAMLIVGITLVIGIYVAGVMQTTFRTTGVSVSAVNESIAVPSTAGITLAGGAALDGSCGTVVLLNGTSGVPIAAANYTQTDCVLTNSTGEFVEYDTITATYTYTFTNDTSSSTASGNLVISLASGSGWITILIVIGFALIVLGMLSEGLSGAARKNQVESGFAY